MTGITFGVASSSLTANMAVKANALNCVNQFPLPSAVVLTSFYVDDGVIVADSLQGAINLQMELQKIFACRGFANGRQAILMLYDIFLLIY